MTRRFTSNSLAGTSRNDVAVGTARLASMLVTIRAAAPLSGSPGTSTVPSAAIPVDGAAPVGVAPGVGAPTAGTWLVSPIRPVAGSATSGVEATTSRSRW